MNHSFLQQKTKLRFKLDSQIHFTESLSCCSYVMDAENLEKFYHNQYNNFQNYESFLNGLPFPDFCERDF